MLDPHDVAAIVIDLGRIEAKTFFVKKERNVDYSKELDQSKIYDTIQVKFGKLKIVTDYNLNFQQSLIGGTISDKMLNWNYSQDKVDLTNEINFGF